MNAYNTHASTHTNTKADANTLGIFTYMKPICHHKYAGFVGALCALCGDQDCDIYDELR